jgi:hypothetical protein
LAAVSLSIAAQFGAELSERKGVAGIVALSPSGPSTKWCEAFWSYTKGMLASRNRKVVIMLNWVRLLISVFVLAVALAGGTGGASAASSHHHYCAAMAMDMDDSSCCDGDNGTASPCNQSAFCAGPQILIPPQSSFQARTIFAMAAEPPRDFVAPRGLSSAPDLRPPIA